MTPGTGCDVGWGRTGISRADSASGELNVACAAPTSCGLQQQWASRYFRAGAQHSPQTSHLAAYPPPRASCVTGAERAAMDKRFWRVLVGCGQQAAAHPPIGWCASGRRSAILRHPARTSKFGLAFAPCQLPAPAPQPSRIGAGPCADPQPRSPAPARSKLYNPHHPERTVLYRAVAGHSEKRLRYFMRRVRSAHCVVNVQTGAADAKARRRGAGHAGRAPGRPPMARLAQHQDQVKPSASPVLAQW